MLAAAWGCGTFGGVARRKGHKRRSRRATAPPEALPAIHVDAPPGRRLAAWLLLAAGAGLFALVGYDRPWADKPVAMPGVVRWAIVILVMSTALVPAMRERGFAFLQSLRTPQPRSRARTALLIAAFATAYLVFTAHQQGRDLFPKTHDEQSYLIQMQMLAEGRLWMDAHPLADFFDTFYVLVRPKYASLYFPGASLLYVPAIWLGLPTWLLPALAAGAVVGLAYRIVAELLDGVAGMLAAMLLVSLGWFRVYSVLVTGHVPMLLLGLLMFWAWLRWRNRRRTIWAVLVGIFAGWGAITRPADALCFALPIGVGMLLDLLGARDDRGDESQREQHRPRATPGRLALTGAALIGGAAPFLALQLVFNKGVTGDWLKTPYTYYLERDQPGTSFGFHAYDPAARPQSTLRQKQDYYATFLSDFVRTHQPDTVGPQWGRVYLRMMVDTALPGRELLVLLPLGLMGLHCRRRRVFAAVVPLFIGVYVLNTFFLEHYALQIAPAVIVLVLLAGGALERAWPAARAGIATAFTLGIATLSLLMLPEVRPLFGEEYTYDETFIASPYIRTLNEIGDGPESAVILFRYAPEQLPPNAPNKIMEEPVYNTTAAWPDAARVIRAHDLGPARNAEIIRYYAARDPDRIFIWFNRSTGEQHILGTARELAARLDAEPDVRITP